MENPLFTAKVLLRVFAMSCIAASRQLSFMSCPCSMVCRSFIGCRMMLFIWIASLSWCVTRSELTECWRLGYPLLVVFLSLLSILTVSAFMSHRLDFALCCFWARLVIAARRSSNVWPSFCFTPSCLAAKSHASWEVPIILETGVSVGSQTLVLCVSFLRAASSRSVGGGSLAACSASYWYLFFIGFCLTRAYARHASQVLSLCSMMCFLRHELQLLHLSEEVVLIAPARGGRAPSYPAAGGRAPSYPAVLPSCVTI